MTFVIYRCTHPTKCPGNSNVGRICSCAVRERKELVDSKEVSFCVTLDLADLGFYLTPKQVQAASVIAKDNIIEGVIMKDENRFVPLQ